MKKNCFLVLSVLFVAFNVGAESSSNDEATILARIQKTPLSQLTKQDQVFFAKNVLKIDPKSWVWVNTNVLTRSRNPDEIQKILDTYRVTLQEPPEAIRLVEARIAGLKGECSKEIKIYQDLLTQIDDLHLKTELIAALFEQNRIDEAKTLMNQVLEKLRNHKDLTSLEIITYLLKLPKRDENTNLATSYWVKSYGRNFYCKQK